MSAKSRKRSRDLNKMASEIVEEATGDAPKALPDDPDKDPAAVALGRKGGQKSAEAREKLTSEERSERAKKAARARWERDS